MCKNKYKKICKNVCTICTTICTICKIICKGEFSGQYAEYENSRLKMEKMGIKTVHNMHSNLQMRAAPKLNLGMDVKTCSAISVQGGCKHST
jgi:hypothetical protein